MRWQRPVRVAIAIFVLGFAAVVWFTVRRPERAKPVMSTPRKNPETVVESGPWEQKRYTPDGRLHFSISVASSETFPDGRKIGKDAVLVLPDRNGRSFQVEAGRMEILPPEKAGSTEISL